MMTKRDEGACANARGRLTALRDEELAGDEAVEVRAHLAECASCQQEWEGLTAAQNLAAQWTVGDTPDLWPALREQIAPTPWEEVLAELRLLRAEVAGLRRELAARPAPIARRSTPLDLPYVPKVSRSQFQLV